MAGLYDNYQLANSQLVQQYQGRPVTQALVNVGKELQNRYDYSRDQFDVIGSAIDNSQILEKDRALFNDTVGQYRNQISEAAKSGKYEDMVYNVNKLGRDFASTYKPFANVLQQRQAAHAEIDKALQNGTLKDPQSAEMLKRYNDFQYQGLVKDPTTGQVKGGYNAAGIAKEIDPTAKVDEWMDKYAPQVLGSSVRKINGEYYVTQGGKTTRLSFNDVKDKKGNVIQRGFKHVIDAGMNLDPEWGAYVDQSQRLGTFSLGNYQLSDLPENLRNEVQQMAETTGEPVGKILQSMKASQIRNGIVNNAYQYASKYERNDRESEYSVDGMTESAKMDRQKAIDDKETNNFGIPIIVPNPGSKYNSPTAIDTGINESDSNVRRVTEDYSAYLQRSGAKAAGNGRYKDKEGLDVTDRVMQYQLLLNQEGKRIQQLNQLRQDVMEEAGYKVTPELQRKANEAYREAYENYTPSIATSSVGIGAPVMGNPPSKEKIAQQAYDRVLKNTPGYARYKELLKSRGENTSLETIATRFEKKSDNEAIERLINNLSTNDFDSSLLSAEYVGSKKGGQAFVGKDFEKIKGDTKFAGQYMDASGEQAFIFTAEDPKTKEKTQFQVKGIISKQPFSKLTGTDAVQARVQQVVRGIERSPGSKEKLQLRHGSVEVRMPNSSGKREYGIIIEQNGRREERLFPREEDLTNALSNIIKVDGQQ